LIYTLRNFTDKPFVGLKALITGHQAAPPQSLKSGLYVLVLWDTGWAQVQKNFSKLSQIVLIYMFLIYRTILAIAPSGYDQFLLTTPPSYSAEAKLILHYWANTGYQPIVYGPEVSDAELVACAAQAINDAHLDMLMIYGHERENHTYALLDLIDTPCIVHLCNSPDIIHHEKVSYYIYTHPEGKYYLQGHQLFCAATQAPFSSKRMYPGSLYYDPRGFDLNAPVPLWAERDPLIVFHGALYKLAKSDVLDIIMQLLHEDSALEFVFMGRTDRQNWQLPRIESRAKRYGVASRVHYAGNFLARWDVTCSQVVPDWDKIVAYLQRARLYANPFPYGGGQARFQNYAAGVPCIHMGVEFGVSRGWRQYLVEVPALLVPSGTAFSQAEYLALCQRCLHDEEFANQLIEEQRVVGRRASDPSVYWGQLFDSYDDWLSQVNSKGESK